MWGEPFHMEVYVWTFLVSLLCSQSPLCVVLFHISAAWEVLLAPVVLGARPYDGPGAVSQGTQGVHCSLRLLAMELA